MSQLTDWNEFGASNRCVISSDGTKLFINDTLDITVWVYDVNDNGTISNKRPFAELLLPDKPRVYEGKILSGADGMTIDKSGNLYVASDLGIQIFTNKGQLLGIIQMPTITTHLVFGGDGLSTLYITCKDRLYSIQTNMKGYQYPIE